MTAAVQDYTSGSIARQMAAFALPHMLSSAMQILYSAVDLGIVGKAVSGAALSAVSVSGNLMNLLTMVSLGFSTGGQIYMSQTVGLGRQDRLGTVTGTLLAALLAVAAALAALTALLARPLLELMNTPAEAFDMAALYLCICAAGQVFAAVYNGLAAILRALGDPRTPFFAILAASAVNLLLDVLFVAVWKWGVAGAAAATVLGQAVSALVLLAVLRRRAPAWGLRPGSLKPDRAVLGSITRLAVPCALEMATFNVSMLFVGSMVNSVGLYASETFGIGLKVEEIGNKLCTGITCAVSVMVGQNMAAGQITRTKKIVHTAWLYGAALYVLFALLCTFRGRQLFALFVDDREVIELAPVFISALRWGFPAMASMRGTNGLMQGVSNARLSFIIGILDGFCVRIPLSYFLGVTLGLGLWGFFLAYALAAYTNASLGMAYYLSGRWKTRRLEAQR